MHSQKFDAIDRKILSILQDNGKITNAQLSIDVGLSPAPTLERVKKLEKNGVIESYHANLNKQEIGLGVTTFVHVALIGHRKSIVDSFVQQIINIPEVVECHHITGQGDFILKVVSKDIPSYQKLLVEVINEIPEIDNTQSTVILSTFKESRVMPIPDEDKEAEDDGENGSDDSRKLKKSTSKARV
jgi:Lrp/AsnC family transcriptional regulator, leucine-responsive regulatory protein